MTRYIDELSPATVGEDTMTLSVAEGSRNRLIVGKVVDFDIDYSATLPTGIRLPLKLVIQGPTDQSYDERIFRNIAPKSISFVPKEAGEHLVILKECWHNQWIGRLRITVEGEVPIRIRV